MVESTGYEQAEIGRIPTTTRCDGSITGRFLYGFQPRLADPPANPAGSVPVAWTALERGGPGQSIFQDDIQSGTHDTDIRFRPAALHGVSVGIQRSGRAFQPTKPGRQTTNVSGGGF